MKIAYIVPGTGDSFYCANCHRDKMFVSVMKNNPGTSVTAIPLYLLPNKTNFGDLFESKVFFGAISLFFKERVPFARKMPRFVERMLDSPPMLRFAARQAGSTTPVGLEKTTIDMITGNASFLEKETDKLLSYLSEYGQPDVIHLSNALLTGLAAHIRNRTDIPVVCSLQNEDDWINEMREPYRSEAWQRIGESRKNIVRFISSSEYYRKLVSDKTGLPADLIEVINPVTPAEFSVTPRAEGEPPSVGFFSRLSVANGLDKMIEAWLMLGDRVPGVQLHLCGGSTASDTRFIRSQMKIVARAGRSHDLHLHDGFSGTSKEKFFRSIDLLSVPVRKPDAWGQYLIESIGAGVPVVQPATGAFPEIISMTGGGVIYSEDTPQQLAIEMGKLLADRALRITMGEKGAETLRKITGGGVMQERVRNLYYEI